MKKYYHEDIYGNSATYWFNKQSSPPEMFCSIKYGSSLFKKPGIFSEDWAIILPLQVLSIMEYKFIYMVHFETDLAHFFAPIDKFKTKKHPSFESGVLEYACPMKSCIKISKNIKSRLFDLDRLKDIKKQYNGYSIFQNITSDIQILPKEEIRESFYSAPSSIVKTPTQTSEKTISDKSQIMQLKKQEQKIKPKQQFIQGALF